MLEYVQAKLPSFLTSVNLGLARGRQELKVLDQTSQSDGKNRQCKNDSGATPSANPKGKVPKVIAIGFHMQLLLQEPLWPELLWLLPVCRVVGQPPCIHQDLALSWDIIAPKLCVVEVHVWYKERDCHSKTKSFLDHCLEVWELLDVWLSHLVPCFKNSINFIPHLLLDLWVVHKLSNAPFNRP